VETDVYKVRCAVNVLCDVEFFLMSFDLNVGSTSRNRSELHRDVGRIMRQSINAFLSPNKIASSLKKPREENQETLIPAKASSITRSLG
jgi:hypothetical protein